MPASPPPHAIPASSRRFRVALDGADVDVAQVSGLAASPGALGDPRHSPPLVTLRRPVTGDRTLFDWHTRGARRDAEVLVTVLDGDGVHPVAAWALVGARPVRWTGPDLDTTARGCTPTEGLELTYDHLEWRLP